MMKTTPKFLMVQGTSSNSGKSVLTAALCRIFSDEGYRVAPLKAQNMSSNVFMTGEGLEMAKAQALQAIASRTEPSAYMNPILLKPMGDYMSRVVLLGREYREMDAKHYYTKFVMKNGLRIVRRAIRKLTSEYDLIVVEGAGSPAEINLADYDLANMKLAEMLKAPVIIAADIERGGCFASMAGTLQLLEPKHRALVRGFVINKFRGDRSILSAALARFGKISHKPVLGIIPYMDDILLPSEDSLGIGGSGGGDGGGEGITTAGRRGKKKIRVAIIRYPGAVNLSDFDSLLHGSDALGAYHVTPPKRLDDDAADLILLPSSRDIRGDMLWLDESGTAETIRAMHARGIPIIGVGDGYAMMGRRIVMDSGSLSGLGLLDTEVHDDGGGDGRRLNGSIRATISKRSGSIVMAAANGGGDGRGGGRMIEGYLRQDYRIVRGRNAAPLLQIVGMNGRRRRFAEGSVSRDGLAMGTSVNGLFDTPAIRNKVIASISRRKGLKKVPTHELDAATFWDIQIQRLGDTVRKSIDIHRIMKFMGLLD